MDCGHAGKHADALVHVLYMVASDRRQLNKHTDSLCCSVLTQATPTKSRR